MAQIKNILFLDTEFTDFINTELISIGLVSACGEHEFYVELNDYRPQVCSEFVRKNVEPMLDLHKHGKSTIQASARLYCWLEELEQQYIICADNMVDWELLNKLLETLPKNIHAEPLMLLPELRGRLLSKAEELQTPNVVWFFNKGVEEYRAGFKQYFVNNPVPQQHHALADAKANLDGWNRAHAWMNQHY